MRSTEHTHTAPENTAQKLLIIITKSNWGGAQRYVFDIATHLPPERYNVTVALGGEGPLKKKLEATGIRVVPIKYLQRNVSVFKELWVFFALVRYMRAERFDVVHLNSSKIGGLGTVAARVARVPRIVFTSHGFAFNEDRPKLIKILLKFLYWFMMVAATHVIAVSNIMRTRVAHWPLIAKKTVIVYNGIEQRSPLSRTAATDALMTFSPAFDEWRKAHRESLIIGHIGELHPIKGQTCLIEAMTKVPDAALVIIGSGEMHDTLVHEIKVHHLEDRVFLLGPRDVAAQYLSAFDIFAMPSLSEGLAYVSLEVGLAGLPIVASNVGGIPEIVTHEESGLLVRPRDPHALAEALIRLCSDVQLRTRLGAALQQKVRTEFSFETMLKKTMAVYAGSPTTE